MCASLWAASSAAAAAAPEVAITAPTAGSSVRDVVTVRAAATPAESIRQVVFLIDGRRFAVDRSAPYEATWDASATPPGLYAVRAIAYARDGSRSKADREEVQVGDAAPLWTGDLGRWQQRFHATYSVAADRIQAVPSPNGGAQATRFEVRPGDRPIAGGARAELAMFDRRVNGMEAGAAPRYYGWQTFIPADYQPSRDWQTLAQWHQSQGPPAPSPLKLALVRDSAEFALAGRAEPWGDETWLYTAPATRGVWHTFVLGVNWSPDPGEGWVELWHDGAKVLERTHRPTQYSLPDGSPIPNAFKHGLYRSPAIAFTQVVYHRGTRVGLTPASAGPVRAQRNGGRGRGPRSR